MNDSPPPRTTLRTVEVSPSKKKSGLSDDTENGSAVKKNDEPLDSRLVKTAQTMTESYAAWLKKKSLKERETLQESMHELRRVLAAIEISIAMSERD